jgi:RES domain-containing protein
VDLPDKYSSGHPALGDLPADWNAVPTAPGSMELGTKWARDNRSLVLYVPSALVREERNAVLNPDHPEFAAVGLVIERDFHYDPRMFVPRAAPTGA